MAKTSQKILSPAQTEELLTTLKLRFEKNKHRHPDLDWKKIETKLRSNPEKLWTLSQMEDTGGEPDVVDYDKKTDTYIFYDRAAESPKGRRSICYDKEALHSRKEHKPATSALEMAAFIGIEILNEDEYRFLQTLGDFDTKTSSWLKTPAEIRKKGGAIFGDFRYGQVFIYHNGAESYYAARGFRGSVKV